MGTVFMAEQEQPVKRRVAFKIIKAGMDSAHVIALFEQREDMILTCRRYIPVHLIQAWYSFHFFP